MFKDMVDRLFADPVLAKNAIYKPFGAGDGYPVRVMLKQSDNAVSFGAMQIHTSGILFEVRSDDVPAPAVTDTITIADIVHAVQSEPIADREKLIWTLDCCVASE